MRSSSRKIALAAASLMLLSGFDAQSKEESPDADIKRVEIERMTFGEGVTVIHDDKRNVTCWVYRTAQEYGAIHGGGISCTPDWMLVPQQVKS
ncbi:hypothetical protein AB4P95_30045 (plasmid) [Pseudomonas sp. A1437]|uniref:hypothetical protein n=1 Tax=Pseudomonas sp. A1437 TaxID=3235107 RepID=UPI003783C539